MHLCLCCWVRLRWADILWTGAWWAWILSLRTEIKFLAPIYVDKKPCLICGTHSNATTFSELLKHAKTAFFFELYRFSSEKEKLSIVLFLIWKKTEITNSTFYLNSLHFSARKVRSHKRISDNQQKKQNSNFHYDSNWNSANRLVISSFHIRLCFRFCGRCLSLSIKTSTHLQHHSLVT